LENVSKFEKMTTGPVEKLVCEMAVPTIIIMLVSAMYNMAATGFFTAFFIGLLITIGGLVFLSPLARLLGEVVDS
jgi:Na+-driven multidrug efflux pump